MEYGEIIKNLPTIKTYEEACAKLNMSTEMPKLKEGLSEYRIRHLYTHHKLAVIAKALNEGWVPDKNDEQQKVYYPWFTSNHEIGFIAEIPTPLAFKNGHYDTASSHLYYKTKLLAAYAGVQFKDLYKIYYI